MIEIAPCQAGDLAALADVESGQTDSAHWGRAGFEEEFSNKFSLMLRAKDGAEIIGFICFKGVAPEGELLNFAVGREHTNKGCGTMLLSALFAALRAADYKKITLEVREGNTPALNIYLKNGFAPISRRVKFYNGKEDALVMEKHL